MFLRNLTSSAHVARCHAFNTELPPLVKALVLTKMPSALDVVMAGGICRELHAIAAELLAQFRWQCRACGHALYHPKDVQKPSVARVFGTIAQMVDLEHAPGMCYGPEFACLDKALRVELRRAYHLPFAVFEESEFELRAQMAYCSHCRLVVGLVLRRAVVLRDLDMGPELIDGYPRELELSEHGQVLVGSKLVRLKGPVPPRSEQPNVVYACSGARRTRDVVPVPNHPAAGPSGSTQQSVTTGSIVAGPSGRAGNIVAEPSCDASGGNGGSSWQQGGTAVDACAGPQQATCTQHSSLQPACGQPLFESEDVLSRSHCWDAGGGTERAMLVNGLLPTAPTAHTLVNSREEDLIQGPMVVADMLCAHCGACFGWKFVEDKSPGFANEMLVGRFGVVLSSMTHLGPDLDLLFASAPDKKPQRSQ